MLIVRRAKKEINMYICWCLTQISNNRRQLNKLLVDNIEPKLRGP